jgi:hypothetical protein
MLVDLSATESLISFFIAAILHDFALLKGGNSLHRIEMAPRGLTDVVRRGCMWMPPVRHEGLDDVHRNKDN